ncbi:MAG: asparagine synthase C-terminal domain-containing protein, partial [Candidatus Nitrosotenuis sp.]
MDTLSASETASIKNILTLRYDPTMTTHVPKRTADDFLESCTCSVLKIESLIQSNIKNFVKNISENHFSVGLSGGIDSALTIAMLRKAAPDAKIDAISVRFVDSLDESETAKKIGQHFDADVHVINIENYLADLPEAISIIKYPFWDSHWFYVVKNAIRFSKNLLSGDGGDELFAGYTFRYEKFLSLYNQDMSAMKKTQLYMDCHQRDWVPDQDKIFGSKIKFEWSEIYKQILTNFDNSLGPLNQVFLADFNGKLLYNWIPINKSLHDHFGLNSLSPLLSAELISY